MNIVKADRNLLKQVANNDLRRTQMSGFYKTNYLADKLDHFSDPPIVTIKPNYRAAIPGNVQIKNKYSFSPFGE